MYTETARAKINLNLHVGRLIQDSHHQYYGYHPLSSLVVFADYGDRLTCQKNIHAANGTYLTISGPFEAGLKTDRRNLILRAYETVRTYGELPNLHFHLEKNVPIASGIGGGSADAAAALRLLKHYVQLPDNLWQDMALSLGADVPVCLSSRTCIMSGMGDQLNYINNLGNLMALLVNPMVVVSTGAVFRHYDEILDVQSASISLEQGRGSLMHRIKQSGNALQKSAIKLCPPIEDCLQALISSGAQISRMSGSGATCFGVFDCVDALVRAEHRIKNYYPNWWIQPVLLGDAR